MNRNRFVKKVTVGEQVLNVCCWVVILGSSLFLGSSLVAAAALRMAGGPV